MAKHNRYDDKFKASAVVLLESEGYPDDKYAISRVASHLGIPGRTLRRWANGQEGAPPDNAVSVEKKLLEDVIDDEIHAAFKAMSQVREDASYRDLVIGAATLIDKKQLITGGATERTEAKVDYDAGDNLREAILSSVSRIAETRAARTGDQQSDD